MGELIEKWTIEMMKQGVSKQHIENMKFKKLESVYSYNYYYDIEKREEIPIIVETKKIVGINTGWSTSERTVYNLFFSVTNEIRDLEDYPLKYNRIKENIDSLICNGILYQYNFYIDKSKEKFLRDGLPKFQYFKDDDIYFSGATHRTICAMMFDAPHMVGYVTNYKRNKIKYLNFQIYEQVNRVWEHLVCRDLKSVELISTICNQYSDSDYDQYIIRIKDFPELDLIIFDDPIKNPDDFNFNDTQEIRLFESKTMKLTYKIKKIDEIYCSKYKKGIKVPIIFKLLKKIKWYLLYDLLLFLKYENKLVLNISQPVNEIVKGIRKSLFSYIVNENRYINSSYSSSK